MKKNGFTLIEVLSVVILLSLLFGIGIPGIKHISQNMKKKSLNTKIRLIEQAGVLWGQDNKTLLQANDDCIDKDGNYTKCYKITINQLIEEDYLNSENYNEIVYTNPINKENIKDICVYVYKKNNRVYAYYSQTDKTCYVIPVEEQEQCGGYTAESDTLTCKIMNDERITKKFNIPIFNGPATTEEGMYSAEDDYGTSWYFRGKASYNYVKFANFTWRIVRINGNGSVRLILEGEIQEKLSKFNDVLEDNAKVGYMYGFSGITGPACLINKKDTIIGEQKAENLCEEAGGEWKSAYELTHMNFNDSKIKEEIDSFYEKNLSEYNKYMSDTIFCGDKSIYNKDSMSGYSQQTTTYSAFNRLYASGTATPVLKCAENEEYDFSRYTVDKHATIKGVETNGDLKYPIALLSADELVMAGGWGGTSNRKNEKFYLFYSTSKPYPKWHTMTPFKFNVWGYIGGSQASDGYSLNMLANSDTGVMRPVINLKKTVVISSGDGTIAHPYTIK